MRPPTTGTGAVALSIDPDDLAAVTEQMGRVPLGMLGVAARDAAGRPRVILTHPVRRRAGRVQPFPTIYWLTCPHLVLELSRLESRGLIGHLNARLEEDEALCRQLNDDHEAYIADRWALLSSTDRLAVQEHGLCDAFLQRGIGGIFHRRRVKCLHLHYAHHLARANVIGRILQTEFNVPA